MMPAKTAVSYSIANYALVPTWTFTLTHSEHEVGSNGSQPWRGGDTGGAPCFNNPQ